MSNQSRCLGCGNPSQLGARVWSRLFLPLPAPSGLIPFSKQGFCEDAPAECWGWLSSAMGGDVVVALPLSLRPVLSSQGVTAFAEGGVPALSLCFVSPFHKAVTTPTWVQCQLELPALLPAGWGKVFCDTATPWDPRLQECPPGVCHRVSLKAPWRPECGFPVLKRLIKKREKDFLYRQIVVGQGGTV